MQRHPEFTLADALGNVDYTFGSEGEANRTGGLPLDVTKVRRVWPCQGGEGHFMARLVKAGTPRAMPAPGEYTPKSSSGWRRPPRRVKKAAKARESPQRACTRPMPAVPGGRSPQLPRGRAGPEYPHPGRRGRGSHPAQSLAAWQGVCGPVLPGAGPAPGGGAWRRGAAACAVPQTTLHVLRAGVFVGSVQKGRFVPEHHLFTAFGAQCTNREELTLTDPRTVEYLSGREIEARTAADGWCCVTVDGWPLGGGKVSGGRVKNHYPKALRLL